MTGKQLTEYFRHVMELECSIQCQTQVMEDVKNIRPKYPPEPIPQKPQHNYAIRRLYDERNMLMPEEPVKEKNEMEEPQEPVLKFREPCRSIAVTLFEVLLVIASFAMLIAGSFAGFLLSILMAVVLHVLGHLIVYKTDTNSYNRRMENYCAECARIQKEYDEKKKAYAQAKAVYDAKSDSIEKKIKAVENEIYEANDRSRQQWIKQKQELVITLEQAKEEVRRLAGPIAEAKKTLKVFYDKGIIYPKYRNIVAICTIFEYLDSGRCSTLEGPNGAYNLYESELRQNLIISKLDEVIANMNIIQRNQYQLYKKLDSIDSTVKNIHRSVNQIASSTKAIATDVESIKASTANIAHNSQITALSSVITAQCAVITAQNTEAMKYISLIH